MGEATFTFRVEDALKSAFGEAAKARDQTAAQLLRGFMRDYVKRQQEEAEYTPGSIGRSRLVLILQMREISFPQRKSN